MNAKWKIILLVMLIISSVCGFFIFLFVDDSRENLQFLVDREVSGIKAVIHTIEQDNNQRYRNRIKSFVNYRKFPQRETIVDAFSRKDREGLLLNSKLFLQLLQSENPYFTSMGWVDVDNSTVLRVHRPEVFGDNVSEVRSDIAEANRKKEQQYGYLVGKFGLQYSIVQPVSYQGQHVGVVTFGLGSDLLLDAIYEELDLPVAIVFPNAKFASVAAQPKNSITGKSHTALSKQLDLFSNDLNKIDWDIDRQQFVYQEKTYLLAKAIDLYNHEQKIEGTVFVALNITAALEKLENRIIFVFASSVAVLLLSFALLYTSYGSLVQKIITLNESLEKNNLKLEDRVAERTAKLQQSEERMQSILNHAPVGILIVDPQTRKIQYANPTICQLLGYTQEELDSMGIEKLHPQSALEHVLGQFTEQALGKKVLGTDIPFLCKSGDLLDADIASALLEIDDRELLVGFILDRTERKALGLQLNRAQKMEAIGLMASGVAHDLNNILAGTINYPELLLRKLPENSNMRPSLEAIRDSGQRAADVVADLLTVARGAASTREPYDINSLVQEYLCSPECKNIKSSHPGVSCSQMLNAERPFVDCSPVHIKKALMNLVLNAAEAVGEGGYVAITTSNHIVEENNHEFAAGEYVLLTVSDNGPGISQTDLQHIFEPFYSKKKMGKSGSGLGLAVVWNTVQDHDGKIFVESGESGTSFKMYFPVSHQQVIDSPDIALSADLSGNREHVLVIDDEPQLRDIACQMLRVLNYRVDSVCSGELALEFIRDIQVDLVVIDMLMEPGMNGRETYEKILELNPGQKAIIASGYSENEDVARALQLGAGDFISKPYSITKLGQAVKQVLEG